LDLLKGFINILIKELRELIRDPKIFLGMIIVPLIIFPVLGGIMNYSMQSAQEKSRKTVVLVLDHDGGENSTRFINYLNGSLRVFKADFSAVEDVVPLLQEYNATEIIEIPEDFSRNVTTGVGVHVNFYSVFSGGGILEGIGSSMIDYLVEKYNRDVAPDIVLPEKSVIIKENIAEGVDPNALSGLMLSQGIAMPITIMILLQVSMQIAATSVAMEKEEKTLETLLSLPVDRFAILMGKLSGSILIAAVGALTYIVGFSYYMASFTAAIPADTSLDLVSLGLAPSFFGLLLLGTSLFVTLLSALALAVIISAFAEDVRGAQSLVGFIYPLIFIPSLLLMYLDINSLPIALRIFMYAIPFSHPIIASKAVTMGDHWTAVWGIVYVTAFTLVIMYAASRLFATEKILTAKLKFKWLRRRKRTPAE
jgi:ABC-2 type transport system permease protein